MFRSPDSAGHAFDGNLVAFQVAGQHDLAKVASAQLLENGVVVDGVESRSVDAVFSDGFIAAELLAGRDE